MSKTLSAIYGIRRLDEFSRMDSPIHRIHPLAKLITTIFYIGIVVSYGKYDIAGLLVCFGYPVLLFALSDVPVLPLLKKLLPVLPFVIGIGVLNPFFDTQTIEFAGWPFSRGWLTFFSLALKTGLTVTGSLLLLATTGMDRISHALRLLRIPKLLVLQLLLTYRYITVLTDEVARMTTAYSLRAPGSRGIAFRAWGSFAGQLLLRTFDRAQRIYQAMTLRGFDGEYDAGTLSRTGSGSRMKSVAAPGKPGLKDAAYVFGWSAFFLLIRVYNVPVLLETLLKGGFSQ